MRRLLLVVLLTFACLAGPGTASADAPWQWVAGHAWWGYNYVTPSTNYWVPGPTNWWMSQEINKSNGGWATYGFFSYTTSNWCLINLNGNAWDAIIAEWQGCGGYNRPHIGYHSGNSSYLRTDAWYS